MSRQSVSKYISIVSGVFAASAAIALVSHSANAAKPTQPEPLSHVLAMDIDADTGIYGVTASSPGPFIVEVCASRPGATYILSVKRGGATVWPDVIGQSEPGYCREFAGQPGGDLSVELMDMPFARYDLTVRAAVHLVTVPSAAGTATLVGTGKCAGLGPWALCE